ncbi:methionyl-tRNA formyltransferase [Pelodictyon luteolum]|uniref:Methionyl-tRNA formyltransferase n=1 Tax=Chlorobium luteolum (strain DSM 273 / BCRC 81028 / 2530) TaxID=319225 RepID=FMT_CHLL3|nr:methionyl-tRNA formyltransferase [Pelodictyon luteolum]Q3B2V0.1 RecName: Full=Methionyl-tRNA formyltransferase [Pelodictyon luteolum DSM 273]ABB24331.1 methionyl-tRNA formyltransferase [Pelodictyon luteolum DSM 273]
MRILFMGTPEFAVPSLRAVAGAGPGFEVVMVVTGPDRPRRSRNSAPEPTPVKQAALELGLRVLEVEDVKDPAFASTVQELRPDVIVVAAFRILPPAVYGAARLGSFNLHASLLPAYRGAAPINHALMQGDRESGVTTFFLQQQVDTGNIILKRSTPVGSDENATELALRLSFIGAEAVLATLRLIAEGRADVSLQDESMASKAPKLTRQNTRIDWNRSAADLHNFIRGLSMRPAAWTTLGGKSVKIFRSAAAPQMSPSSPCAPGSLLIDDGRLYARGTDGWIELLLLQLEGKRPMEAPEFVRGFRPEVTEPQLV